MPALLPECRGDHVEPVARHLADLALEREVIRELRNGYVHGKVDRVAAACHELVGAERRLDPRSAAAAVLLALVADDAEGPAAGAFSTTWVGVGGSGFPMPRSMMSSPARRASRVRRATSDRMWRGRRLSLLKSCRTAIALGPAGYFASWRSPDPCAQLAGAKLRRPLPADISARAPAR